MEIKWLWNLLLCGGDKSSQQRDIEHAKTYWLEYKEHKHERISNLHEFLMEGLANREEALDYLDVALEEYQEDGDTPFLLRSIKIVIEAQGGFSELAKRTHMSLMPC